MKPLYYLLPLMGAALAQELVEDQCELSCPQVKCATDDAVALCKCINGRETLCKKRCPKYKPQYVPCPISPPTPIATPSPKPTWKPVTCECPLVNCLQVWPGSCYCANGAAQNCYDRCGGAPPKLQECPPYDNSVEVREAAPEPKPEAAVAKPACECEQIMCIQMWPDSCYCGNAAAEACYKKCGGKKPELQTCPPQTTLVVSTKPKPSTTSRKPTPTPTKTPKPTPTVLPPNPHPVCGGGRANYLTCEEGYTCILDPYTPGCGHLCDGLGICVKEKMCGGFAGFPCEEKGQVCHDDPRDECDPKSGGADCGGLCVWPHRPLGS